MNDSEFYRRKWEKDRRESVNFFKGLLIALPISVGLWILVILFLLWLFGHIA